MKISILGSRGSFPTPSHEFLNYGGNTSCVHISFSDIDIVIDAGTGFANFNPSKNNETIIMLSHFHHDHISGLAANQSMFDPNIKITICSALLDKSDLENTLRTVYGKKYFPLDFLKSSDNILYEDFNKIKEKLKDNIIIDKVKLNHPGDAYGYSFEYKNKKICYLLDHEENVDSEVGRFSRDSDLVFWDGMFLQDEKKKFKGWGHSSIEEGIDLVEKFSIKKLLICHHSPLRKDKELEKIDKLFSNKKIIFAYDNKTLDFK